MIKTRNWGRAPTRLFGRDRTAKRRRFAPTLLSALRALPLALGCFPLSPLPALQVWALKEMHKANVKREEEDNLRVRSPLPPQASNPPPPNPAVLWEEQSRDVRGVERAGGSAHQPEGRLARQHRLHEGVRRE
eukprot:1846298-Rhodomonas_salina.1